MPDLVWYFTDLSNYYITVSGWWTWMEQIFTARRVCIARTMPWQDVCLSVSLSHSGIESKRLYISSKFFSPSGSPTILVFPYQTGRQYSDGDPLTGALTARGLWKNTIYYGKCIKISCMIYRSALFPMILNDPYAQFQGDAIFDAEYLRNGMTYSFNEILILTNTRPTQQCYFEWPWVT